MAVIPTIGLHGRDAYRRGEVALCIRWWSDESCVMFLAWQCLSVNYVVHDQGTDITVTSSKLVQVDGIVHFPESLPVNRDALGKHIDAEIAEIPVKFTFPIESSESVGAGLAPPKNRAGEDIAPQLEIYRNEWGIKTDAETYMVGAARASFSVTAPTAGDPLPDDVRRLGDQFNSWFDILYNWVTAWSNMVNQRFNAIRSSAFHYVLPDDRLTGTATHISVAMGNVVRPLNLDQLTSAIFRASSGILLPSEHRLILSAKTALVDHDYRQAVIDGGTAAEVALASKISATLRSNDLREDYIEYTILHASGLSGLMSVYLSLGHQPAISKRKADDQLAQIRNKAAHADYLPSSEEAARAVGHASALVHEACPLPII